MAAVRINKLDPAGPRKIIEASLQEALGGFTTHQVVSVGDQLDVGEASETILRGHGTQTRPDSDALVASVVGVVERVDQLVTVRTVRSRYLAEVGDVVVGRVAEIGGKRWRLDLGSRHEATLLLSAVDLPGGVQRRRTAEDELAMRAVFAEGAALAVEVQSVHNDGSLALHARSARYGALGQGTLVRVPAALVRRQARHFQRLEALGVDAILGCNGAVWVCPARLGRAQAHGLFSATQYRGTAAADGAAQAQEPVSKAERQQVARVAQAVRALGALYLPIDAPSIDEVVRLADAEGLPTPDMCRAGFLATLAGRIAQLRVAAYEDNGEEGS
ncbi:hypothetical protein QBZ16_002457 [Prototheca wickerhamii]|uniref:Ribosomal RNA-processing protein 4 n=1 Tax=Prototheca wickerhamii TaxID=3111 RepID=A0AAD9IKC2_PROWI|nr:hypothetical protein QBZ16_002457 [Prototheca wickerhamii]